MSAITNVSTVKAPSNQPHYTLSKLVVNYFCNEDVLIKCVKKGLELPAMYNQFPSISPALQ